MENAPLDTLLENHRTFLRYFESRVGDRTLAEDILHDAFARPRQGLKDEPRNCDATPKL